MVFLRLATSVFGVDMRYAVIFSAVMQSVPLFLGGVVSGHVMSPVLPRDRSRWLYVALASPASVYLLSVALFAVSPVGNLDVKGIPWVVFFVASVAFGFAFRRALGVEI